MRKVWSSWVVLAAAGALTGCSGGGGSGGGGAGAVARTGLTISTDRSGPADFNAEMTRNYGLAAVGATGPYAAGRTGAGIKVGIIDTGIDLQHKDLAGAIDADSMDIVSGVKANVDDVGGHGTSVAGVIGARADGYDVVGVAPGSTLLAVRADSSCNPGCSFANADTAAATDYAIAHGAKVLNYSLGGAALGSDFQAALSRAAAGDHVVVAAAGNDAATNPTNPAAFLAGAGGNGNGLAVGAVDSTNTLAWFSNKAGDAKDHFLVAPGVSITTLANGGGTRRVNGTSFSAPMVTGAAAVVWGASPFLTSQNVVDILLNSATDLGAAGVDDIYGHGLLNLNQALQPLGVATIPTGSNVASGGAALSATSLNLGGAFGDALAKSTALDQAMFVDSYGRPYHTDLGGSVHAQAKADPLSGWLGNGGEVVTSQPAPGTSFTLAMPPETPLALESRPGEDQPQPRFALSTRLNGTRLGLARGFGLDQLTGLTALEPGLAPSGPGGNAMASPFLALSGEGSSMTAGRSLGDGTSLSFGFSQDGGALSSSPLPEPERKSMMAETAKRFEDGTLIGGHLGTLTESGGPLASAADGAFDFGRNANTLFLGVFGATPLSGSTTLFGRWGWGNTDSSALASGLVTGGSDITSQSFALGSAMRDVALDGDKVSFTLSRPLRVNSGSANLAVPMGRTMEGEVLYRQQRVGLTPSGAETDFELSWAIPAGERQQMILGGMMALEPGHDAHAGPAFAAGAKYKLSW